MIQHARDLARRLVEIGAVSFSPAAPYTWASGLLSPMYCDNRLTLAHPEVRERIAASFEALFNAQGLEPEAIIGVATGAIPHATILAERLALPLGYVRTEAKRHGKQNQIEGFKSEGRRVVVLEDLISTGGSSIAAALAARESGMIVEAVAAIFTYGFPIAGAAFDKERMPLHALVHLDDLMEAATAAGSLDESDRTTLRKWRSDPVRWSDLHKVAP